MDPRLQRRVQRYGWDKAEAFYEQYWAEQLRPAQDKLLEMAALQPGERVLDIACGTGLVTLRVAEAVGESGAVVGTDISQKMVEALKKRTAEAGLSQVVADRMEAESILLPDASFDVALCALGLMYVPEPLESLTEMHRVLKPGGRAVAAVWGARKNCGWAEIFPIVDARVESEVCPMFFQLGGGEAMAFVFEQAGFSDVSTERIETRLHYASADDAIGAAFAGGPVALAYAKFDDKTKDEAHAEYLASIAGFESAGRYDIPGEFVITRGVKS